MRTRNVLLLAFLLLFATAASAQSFEAVLSGANEVPSGDPDGSGTAQIDIAGTTVNYSITVDGITATPVAQHIHVGDAGVNGPIVVNLPGAWSCAPGPAPPCTLVGSTTTTLVQANAIVANPSGFYVNVHTSDFPGGAVRGQLAAVPPVPATSTLGLVAMALVLAVAGIFVVRRL